MTATPVGGRPLDPRVDVSTLRWRTTGNQAHADHGVQVALLPNGHVAVRNSREPTGAILEFTEAEWEAFLIGAGRNEFNPECLKE